MGLVYYIYIILLHNQSVLRQRQMASGTIERGKYIKEISRTKNEQLVNLDYSFFSRNNDNVNLNCNFQLGENVTVNTNDILFRNLPRGQGEKFIIVINRVSYCLMINNTNMVWYDSNTTFSDAWARGSVSYTCFDNPTQ